MNAKIQKLRNDMLVTDSDGTQYVIFPVTLADAVVVRTDSGDTTLSNYLLTISDEWGDGDKVTVSHDGEHTTIVTIESDSSKAQKPVIFVKWNEYGYVKITIDSSITSNRDIYYTLDGSIPSLSSTLYTGPILISEVGEYTIAAVAHQEGLRLSSPAYTTFELVRASAPSIDTQEHEDSYEISVTGVTDSHITLIANPVILADSNPNYGEEDLLHSLSGEGNGTSTSSLVINKTNELQVFKVYVTASEKGKANWNNLNADDEGLEIVINSISNGTR